MRLFLIIAGTMFALIHNVALAALPYVFTPGGTIRAAEINADNAYLENLINSSGQPQPTQLVRAAISNNSATYTVPSGATRPYVIRQIILPPGITCLMYVGSTGFTIGGLMTNLEIPAGASESLSVTTCVNSGGTGFGGNVLVVLSQ